MTPYSYRDDSAVPKFDDRRPLYVFDGECALCSRGAAFLMHHDPAGRIRFTSARGPLGQALCAHFGLPLDETYLLLDQGRLYIKTDGFLHVFRLLGGWWRLLTAAALVPRVLRDAAYGVLARNRLRWFGSADRCALLTPEQRARMIRALLLLLAVGQAAPDPFYAKHLDAAGIPIISSARVSDEALTTARDIVAEMLATRPDLARWLVANGYRVAVMAPDETTTDLPEQRGWTRPARNDPRLTRCERIHYDERIGRLTDRQYWDARARGMAGPLTSAAAENLLAGVRDRYHGENIFVHEFSHDILAALRAVDPARYAAIDAAYRAALKAGRWKGEYASTTVDEYWAVGTQFWFNSGRIATFDTVHVLSDADLSAYDPPLAAALRAVYGNRHRLAADRFWMHSDRVPPGPLPKYTAEVC